MAEFALMLPFLLMMIFMIIEFGRMFQSWVTLQNSARAAARYNSTGQVKYDIFDVPEGEPIDLIVLNTIVPCDGNGPVDGTNAFYINDLGAVDLVHDVATYNGPDGLFATWYDGTDCDPTLDDHTQYRKDILRLISVMHEAREAVSALTPETLPSSDQHYFENLDADGVKDLLYSYWENPMPREDQRAWFNVSICSSRGLLDTVGRTNPTLHPAVTGSRFITVRSSGDLTGINTAAVPEDYPMPYCLLNEIPPAQLAGSSTPYTALDHSGLRWLDAGSPGDRVTIAVTFNHPLITPIRPDEINFLTMRARRSIVNESFRAPKSTRILANPKVTGSQGGGSSQETPETEEVTPTEEITPTEEVIPTATTPAPVFSCENVIAMWGSPPFWLNSIQLFINNNNMETLELQSVEISWKDISDAQWQNMYMGAMALDADVHWAGDATSNAKSGGRTGVTTGQLTGGYRFISAQGSAVWTGTFYNGPTQLDDFMTLYDFAASFVLTSSSGVVCNIELVGPPAGEEPDPIPTDTPGPTPTNTPNCVSVTNRVTLKFGDFTSFGGVYFIVTNNAGRDLNLTGFDLVWPDANHPQIPNEPSDGYGLAKVLVGGADLLDSTNQLVWRSNPPLKPGNTNLVGYNNRTDSRTKGQWVSNATLPPGETRIWLDFDSFGAKLSDFGAKNYHFDTTRFRIACGSGGSGGNGTGGSEGDIGINIPTPTMTRIPKPTSTTGPTNTALAPTMVRTATPSRTPGPPNTPTKTAQATFTPSRTPFSMATQPPSGGGE